MRHHYTLMMVLALVVLGLGGSLYFQDATLTGAVTQITISTAKLDVALVQEISQGQTSPKIIVIVDDERADVVERMGADATVTSEFSTINGFAATVDDPIALKTLTLDDRVSAIYLDYPVQATLDASAPRINATIAWTLNVNNQSITGAGQTVCVIDTGVDYTHPALGGCNPVTYTTTGTTENLSNESAHPYGDNQDITWTITQPNYTSIALHFVNISLESQGAYDTTDRIYIYDGNNVTLAVYKGQLTDVWTPHAQGDTISVRLVSDSSVTDYGYFIDQVLDGTTNSTMNWSNCSVVVGGWDTYNNDGDPKDDHGHGTHVAGTVASRDVTYRGVAPDAQIVAIKALSSAGGGYSSDIMTGIEWCMTNSEALNISAISMSLGCSGGSCPHYQANCASDLTTSVIAQAYVKNIATFIAAGNDGWTDGISNPACVAHAIPVGGADDGEGIVFNRGDLLNILAPGTNINAPVLSGGWASWSGTSMATPHASGASMLVAQYWQQAYNKTITPDELHARLNQSSVLVYDVSSAKNYSRIDVMSALAPLVTILDPTPTSQVANGSVVFNISVDVPAALVLTLVYPNATLENFSTLPLVVNLSTGVYQWYVTATDAFNVTSVSATQAFSAGGLQPILNISAPVEGSVLSQAVLVNLTANGTNITVNQVLALANETVLNITNVSDTNFSHVAFVDVSLASDGNYSYLVSVNSTWGEVTELLYVIVDNTAPAFTVLENTGTYAGSVTTFLVNVTDADLNVSSVIVTSNFTGSWENYTASELSGLFVVVLDTVNVTQGQALYYSFSAVDGAGNVGTSATFNNTVGAAEHRILTPFAGSVHELGNISSYSAITNLTGTIVHGWEFEENSTSDLVGGEITFDHVGTYEIAWNVTNGSATFFENRTISVVDTTPPLVAAIEFSDPVDLSLHNTFKVGVTFEDASIVSSSFMLQEIAYEGTCDPTSCSWDVTAPAVGEYPLVLTVTDAQQNSVTSNHTLKVVACVVCPEAGAPTDVGISAGSMEPVHAVAAQPEKASPIEPTIIMNKTAGLRQDDTQQRTIALSAVFGAIFVLVLLYGLVQRIRD